MPTCFLYLQSKYPYACLQVAAKSSVSGQVLSMWGEGTCLESEFSINDTRAEEVETDSEGDGGDGHTGDGRDTLRNLSRLVCHWPG